MRQRGVVLIIVSGLMAVLLSLAIAVTVLVAEGRRHTVSVHGNVQAYIMLQSAKLWLDKQVRSGATPIFPLTIGDGIPDLAGKPVLAAMGWARVTASAWNPAGPWQVVAAGGGSARTAPKTAISSGDPVVNAFEIRYHYQVERLSPAPAAPQSPYRISSAPVQSNALYPW